MNVVEGEVKVAERDARASAAYLYLLLANLLSPNLAQG